MINNKISLPRTELLVKINKVLLRPFTIRSPVKCKVIKSLYDELLNIGVPKSKLKIIKSLPDDIDICICQLASCCSNSKNCNTCNNIIENYYVDRDVWCKKTENYIYTIFRNGNKIADFNEDDIMMECKYGKECSFIDSGCRYIH
jgi:hypothetical protein